MSTNDFIQDVTCCKHMLHKKYIASHMFGLVYIKMVLSYQFLQQLRVPKCSTTMEESLSRLHDNNAKTSSHRWALVSVCIVLNPHSIHSDGGTSAVFLALPLAK